MHKLTKAQINARKKRRAINKRQRKENRRVLASIVESLAEQTVRRQLTRDAVLAGTP